MKLKAKNSDQVLNDTAHPTIPGQIMELPHNMEVNIPDWAVGHSKDLVDLVTAGEVEIIPDTLGVSTPPLGGTPVGDGSVGLGGFNQYSATEGNFYFNCKTINYDPAVVAHFHKYDMQPVATTDPTKFMMPGADQYIYNTLVIYGQSGAQSWRYRRVTGPTVNPGEYVQLDCRTFLVGDKPGGGLPLFSELRCDYHQLVLSGKIY